ncbi:hypothetical protein [Prosthecodimorpha hirschii]|uniref:hypothetical protein n=1 Tax=Prosthecodimorpha hirschii TaxID=665126 RepID=UPI001126BC60|nr:hypothetical protein [Prosthecomicrobium hirschii]
MAKKPLNPNQFKESKEQLKSEAKKIRAKHPKATVQVYPDPMVEEGANEGKGTITRIEEREGEFPPPRTK